MKKLTVLAATVIAATALTPAMDARAAVKVIYGGGNYITNGQSADLNQILSQIQELCQENNSGTGNIPGQPVIPSLPIIPNQPSDPETPETENPGTGTPESGQEFIAEVVRLVNQERSRNGVAPLTVNTSAQAAAAVRAREIETVFSHTRPDGSNFNTALKEQGVIYSGAGENIAWGQKTPEAVMEGWMNSSGHRANILNPNFTSIGVGHYESGSGAHYWTQLFVQ